MPITRPYSKIYRVLMQQHLAHRLVNADPLLLVGASEAKLTAQVKKASVGLGDHHLCMKGQMLAWLANTAKVLEMEHGSQVSGEMRDLFQWMLPSRQRRKEDSSADYDREDPACFPCNMGVGYW